MQQAVFLQWIELHGGDSSTVKFIETPLPQAVADLEAGRVDAIFLAEPYISMSQGKLRIIGHYWELSLGRRCHLDIARRRRGYQRTEA